MRLTSRAGASPAEVLGKKNVEGPPRRSLYSPPRAESHSLESLRVDVPVVS